MAFSFQFIFVEKLPAKVHLYPQTTKSQTIENELFPRRFPLGIGHCIPTILFGQYAICTKSVIKTEVGNESVFDGYTEEWLDFVVANRNRKIQQLVNNQVLRKRLDRNI
jgi:hypothetical protein